MWWGWHFTSLVHSHKPESPYHPDELKLKSSLQSAWPILFKLSRSWKARRDGETVTCQKWIGDRMPRCNVESWTGSWKSVLMCINGKCVLMEKLMKQKKSPRFNSQMLPILVFQSWKMNHSHVRGIMSQEMNLDVQTVEASVLSLQLLCKYKIIPKLKVCLKNVWELAETKENRVTDTSHVESIRCQYKTSLIC